MSSNILVTGATGNIGGALVPLLQAANTNLRVLSRDEGRARARFGADVDVAVGDLTDAASLAAAFAGCDRALFVGSGASLAAAGGFAKAARAAGVRHIVAVSSGTIDMTPSVALGRWHAEMEDAIASTGVATTFLRPDNFATNSLGWATMIRTQGVVFTASADGQSVPIDTDDIAAVARVALTEAGHEGKIHTLSGPAIMTTRE